MITSLGAAAWLRNRIGAAGLLLFPPNMRSLARDKWRV